MKQMEVTKKTINGTTFYIRPFPAFKAANISGELAGILMPVFAAIAPAFGGLAQGGSAEDQDAALAAAMEEDIDPYLPQIGKALSDLDGNKIEDMMRKLLVDYKNISYDDEDGETSRLTYEDADEIFCGNIAGMYKLCYEVIKVNFGGFFDLIGGQFGSAMLTSVGAKSTNMANLT